jgi:hypothetical protein
MRKLFVVVAAIVASAVVPTSVAIADDDDDTVRCTGQLSGTVAGDLVVPSGATCELRGARVDGDVVVKPSALFVARNSRIDGDVDCAAGPFEQDFGCDLLSGAVVTGDADVRRGGEMHLHAGHVLGEVEAGPGSVFLTTRQVVGPPARALVGEEVECNRCVFLDLDSTDVGGSVSIKAETEGSFIAERSEIAGSLKIADSSAGDFVFFIASNTIHKSATFNENAGSALIVENVIGRKLRVLDNRSAGRFCGDPNDPASCIEGLTVADNHVGKALLCRGNVPPPVGGGNTADRKKGQCRGL